MTPPRPRRAVGTGIALLTTAILLASACTSGSGATAGAVRTRRTITVSAAASLSDAFAKLGQDYERTHPSTRVRFNFGSSTTLALQIEQGAPADVFASADETNVAKLVADHRVVGTPRVFARNRLVIVTKPGDPEHIRTLADLADLHTVAFCAETAPCGKYATQILDRAGVSIPETKVTRGLDARTTLAAVSTGDADAAIVYRTDARAARRAVATVRIRDDQNVIAAYPVAIIERAGEVGAARAFVAYLTSLDAATTLHAFGFLAPK